MDKTNNNSTWQRVASVIQWSNMTINRFATYIGLSRSENLYQIKNGNNGISQSLARRIVAVFPEISIGWLLTGEGQMLHEKNSGVALNCYKGLSSLLSLACGDELQPDWIISFPLVDDCDMALMIADAADVEPLSSEISCGKTYFLQKSTLKDVIPDAKYMILTSKFVYLRKVTIVCDEEPCCRLHLQPIQSDDKALSSAVLADGPILSPLANEAECCDVDVADVLAIYRVRGVYEEL